MMIRSMLFLALAASAMVVSACGPAPTEEVTIDIDDLDLIDEESTDEAKAALANDDTDEASSELSAAVHPARANPARAHPARAHPARVHPARF